MLIVGGTFTVDPDRRDQYLADREEVMRSSRAEKGCLEYTFAADPVEPGRVILFERWENQDALDAHLGALRGRGGNGGVAALTSSIVIYEVASERHLG